MRKQVHTVLVYLRYFASFSCAIHCIITPFLIVSSPVIGVRFANPYLEISLLIISILLCMSIILNNYSKHKKKQPIYLTVIGITLWAINVYLEFNGLEGSIYYSLIGSFFVISAYILNHYFSKHVASSTCKHS